MLEVSCNQTWKGEGSREDTTSINFKHIHVLTVLSVQEFVPTFAPSLIFTGNTHSPDCSYMLKIKNKVGAVADVIYTIDASQYFLDKRKNSHDNQSLVLVRELTQCTVKLL